MVNGGSLRSGRGWRAGMPPSPIFSAGGKQPVPPRETCSIAPIRNISPCYGAAAKKTACLLIPIPSASPLSRDGTRRAGFLLLPVRCSSVLGALDFSMPVPPSSRYAFYRHVPLATMLLPSYSTACTANIIH
jgi:hypothetical protein